MIENLGLLGSTVVTEAVQLSSNLQRDPNYISSLPLLVHPQHTERADVLHAKDSIPGTTNGSQVARLREVTA